MSPGHIHDDDISAGFSPAAAVCHVDPQSPSSSVTLVRVSFLSSLAYVARVVIVSFLFSEEEKIEM